MSSVWNQKATKGGAGEGFEKAPPGNHLAVLVGIFDMGTHDNEFEGKATKPQRRAFFVWELLHEKMSGTKDRNHLIGIDMNVSLNEKATLRKWIEARTGKAIPEGADFDISSELGQPCMLNVIEKTSGKGHKYPKVAGLAGVPKGIPVPKPQTPPTVRSLSDYKEGQPITLPEWVPYHYGHPLADTIADCHELKGKVPAGPAASKPAGNEPPDDSVWFVVKDDGNQERMTGGDVKAHMQKNQLSPESCYVRADGTPPHAVKPAAEFGFPEPIPF